MKPGDRMWIWQGDTGLVEVDIVLVQQTYAAIGAVVGTGQRLPHSYKRFQPTRRQALEEALEGARRRSRKLEGDLLAPDVERAGNELTQRHLAELLLTELESGVAS
ncbi:MAG: hypothetical protein IV100_17715 [Myxococcales bacterium]|nr:hypothetical protein [Myxococcales bacterium]